MAADESSADDGAIFRFWAFVDLLIRERDPDGEGLDDVVRFARALQRFEAGA